MADSRIMLRRGFTLAEMLVVLTIMAILTTAAVQSLGPMTSHAQNDATRHTLASVRDAVFSANTSGMSGFLVDTGRLPVTATSISSLPPSVDELTGVYPYSGTSGPPADLGTYQGIAVSLTISGTTTTTSITINSGWNGPYLLAPSGSYSATSVTSIVDGWGQALPAFLYPDASNGNGLTIWSTGAPTSPQPVSVTLVPSQLTASSLAVNAVDSTHTPKTPTATGSISSFFVAMYGPAPHGTFATSTSSMPVNPMTVEVQFGTAYETNPAPAVYRYTAPFSTSMTLPTWLPTLSGTSLPVLGPRVFCILDNNGCIVAGSSVYQTIYPGSNSVTLLVQ